ncbi:MAG TPA: copper resistance protein B [Burkholderiales bacterium]|nr:copper resistance protein B [Burkholderiales bacterium]
MKTIACKTLQSLVLSLVSISAPAYAQDSMQGMDMSHMQHPAKEPAKSTAKETPHSTKKTQAQEQKPDAHTMPDMDMSSMPGMAMPPPQQQTPTGPHTQYAGAMPGMNMSSAPGMPMQPPPNLTGAMQRLDVGSQIGIRPVVRGLNLENMQMDMQGMQMQGGKTPSNARSPDYSDGVGHGDMTGMDMLDDAALCMLLVDRLEYVDGREVNGAALEAQAWYGSDANKLWLKVEGEHSGGRLQDLRSEALWAHPIGIYWNTQLGLRHDFGVGPDRTWAVFGVQGLAPYWFDVDAAFYVGSSGRTALRFESEYELLLTQRLILQPRFEINFYGRDDSRRDIGSGLSDAELGLRLRYEFTRQFAPYVGVEATSKFGKTADFARSAGESAFDPRLVAGFRIWF